jgi:tetratricopeptide (TPR) repeat protein
VDLISESLEVRFRWLAARLTLESGPAEEAIEMVMALMEDMESGVYGSLEAEELASIESHLILIKGEAEITSGSKSEGLETFAVLREKFPRSGPAILSYLVESRSESDADNLVNAQQSLIALVDRFPTSEYAPIALWEAALNAEQRGLNPHLQEAIAILERLVTEYPNHELVYFARLKQGDLARRLNDFPTALLLFERLLTQYPNHPERYRAELSRADCLMALGSEDPARFDQAAVVYERNCLLNVAPLPVRMEAGFKWAHSLRQQGDIEGSEAVFWLLYERFVVDPDLNQSIVHGEAGRYWVARVLLELGELQSQKGAVSTAKQIYEILLEMKLPGTALARSRIEALE